jgi:uncharacterized membrane protein
MKVFSMLIAAIVLLFLPACATNAKPDVTTAHYTTDILSAVTELQKGVTQMTDQKLLPVPVAQQITGYVKDVYAKSGDLDEALKAYHSATSATEKQSKAALIQTLLSQLDGPIASILGVAVPEGSVQRLTKLVGTVMNVVGAVQQEVAKGLGGETTTPVKTGGNTW